MLIRKTPGWAIPEAMATPESVFLNRRQIVAAMGGAGAAALVPGILPRQALAATPSMADRFPAPRNGRYVLDRPLTDEVIASRYNNFYEFGSHKEIWRAAQELRTRPWKIVIDGAVEKKLVLSVDDLFARVNFEERLYRHRCVEAWSMAVPWTGFPMKDLVALARPTSAARYVEMITFKDKSMAPGQKQFWYPWPYVEGVTMAEATNEMAFLVTGVYGKELPKQHGAPLRLALPWKYGFKSIKSIVRFRFTDKRPVSFWQHLADSEYGFWANVNPAVPHPRWSQASERVLGTDRRVPTQLYNGYGPYVADLYKGMSGEKLFM